MHVHVPWLSDESRGGLSGAAPNQRRRINGPGLYSQNSGLVSCFS